MLNISAIASNRPSIHVFPFYITLGVLTNVWSGDILSNLAVFFGKNITILSTLG